MLGFVSGFLAPFRGFARLLARPSLWPWAAAPIALNVVLCVGVAYLWGWVLAPRAEQWVVDSVGLTGFFADAGHWVVRVVLFLAALPLLLGVYLVLAGIVGGPFYEVLCAATESEQLGSKVEGPRRRMLGALVAGVRVEIGNLFVTLVGGVAALAAALLLPPFGAVLATGLGWFLAGFGYLAYPFDRRTLSLGQKLRIVFRRLDVALGFGLATYVLLIPVVTVPLVAPCAVIGAALLFPGGRFGRGGR
jgi:CysZ protein